uniref:Laminin, alpha 2 n=1 Tax=Nothobranchius korthausae TaxID=1143690 RepID=A0A1A8G7H2_9TELE
MVMLGAIPNDTAAKLAATKAVAAEANATATDVLERLRDLNLRIGGLQQNYSELEDTVNSANQMIQDPDQNTIIHAAGAKVKDLEDEADRLLEKLQPIKKLQDNLRRNISQIKELINQARKQANSIKVSVSSGGDCLRSYRPDIRKGRYNTIILHVKTTTPDNLLFYLGSAKYVDFLALEMRKGKVNFLWDVGSGVGRVEYPHLTIHDGNWHRIEASRNGLNGTISIYPLEGTKAGMMPTPASSNSPTAFTILDVDQNAYLFVGGIFGTIKKAEAVRTSTFSGCMGETFLDGKPIGLWNYRKREGDCKGCVVSPQRTIGEGTVQLDGEGYAAVGRPTRWNPNVSTITFKFRTFSSDALLMYLATEDMKDFMSLELSEGKVKVNFDLGSGVGAALSASRHNDGRWKALTMSRNKKHATVIVVDIDGGAEERITASSQGSATGLNLRENQKIYFGGLPTIGNYRSEVTLKKYAGCLGDIEVSRTPYNLLSSSDYNGVTKGCEVENLYTVSFSKPGYVELSGFSLNVDTEISLSFSTLKDTGTILLAVGGASPGGLQARRANLLSSQRRRRQSGEPYLSVMLNKGSLEVLIFTGSHNPRRVIRRPEQGVLNDGREHSLRIERLPGRFFAVQVDEEPKREAALPNDQPMSLQRVFLGGIPAEVERTSNRANIPFQGCIWNLMVNAVLSDFSQPVSFENAEIGHKGLGEEMETSRPLALMERLNAPAHRTSTTPLSDGASGSGTPFIHKEPSTPSSQIENLLERRTVLQLLLGTGSAGSTASRKDKSGGSYRRSAEAAGGCYETSPATTVLCDSSNEPILDVKVKSELTEEAGPPPARSEDFSSKKRPSGCEKKSQLSDPQQDLKTEARPPEVIAKYGLLSQLLKQQTATYYTNSAVLLESQSTQVKEEQRDYPSPVPKRRRVCPEQSEGLNYIRSPNAADGGYTNMSASPTVQVEPEQQRSLKEEEVPPSETLARESRGFNVLKQLLLSDNCLKELSQQPRGTPSPAVLKANGSSLSQPAHNFLHMPSWHPHGSLNSGLPSNLRPLPTPPSDSTPIRFPWIPQPAPWPVAQKREPPTLVKQEPESPVRWGSQENDGEEEGCDSNPDSPRLSRSNPILYYMLQKGSLQLRKEAYDQGDGVQPAVRVKEEQISDIHAYERSLSSTPQSPTHNDKHSHESQGLSQSFQ